MLKTFTFISYFLCLHKEQEKQAKNGIAFVTNFLPISPFVFTFKRNFFEKPLHKTTLRHVFTSCVYLEAILL